MKYACLSLFILMSGCAGMQTLGDEEKVPGMGQPAGVCDGNAGRPPDGTTCGATILMPTIPVTFSRLELDGDTARLGATMALGIGGMIAIGDITYENQGIAKFDPGFLFGLALNVGAVTSTDLADAGDATGSLSAAVFVGFGPVALTGGRDFLTETWFIGISTNVTTLSLAPKAYTRLGRWGADE